MEITRVLTTGDQVETHAEPTEVDGLAIAPVLLDDADATEDDSTEQPAEGDSDTGSLSTITTATDQWLVLHCSSGRPVVQLPMPRVIAHRFAAELAELDWTVDRETVRSDDPHSSPYLSAVRTAVDKLSDFVGMTDDELTEQLDHDEDQDTDTDTDEEVA